MFNPFFPLIKDRVKLNAGFAKQFHCKIIALYALLHICEGEYNALIYLIHISHIAVCIFDWHFEFSKSFRELFVSLYCGLYVFAEVLRGVRYGIQRDTHHTTRIFQFLQLLGGYVAYITQFLQFLVIFKGLFAKVDKRPRHRTQRTGNPEHGQINVAQSVVEFAEPLR